MFRFGTMSEVIRARASRREGRSCSATPAIAALVLLPACGVGDIGLDLAKSITAPLPPQDCAALSGKSWSVGGIPVLGTELDLNVGESKWAWLRPIVQSECESVLAAVTWAVDAPSIASVQPRNGSKDDVWVTGIAPGQTAVRAHIVFSDGRVQEAQPAAVRVTPRSPPTGSTLVAEGDVALPAPPSHPGASHQFVPFRLKTSGQVDILVDWDSLLNSVDFSVYQSPCSSIESCGSLVPVTEGSYVKPLPATASLAAGDYTIRIDNMGPGAEHAHYEVRLTPG